MRIRIKSLLSVLALVLSTLLFLTLCSVVRRGNNLNWDAAIILAVHNTLSCRFLDISFLIITHSAVYYVFIPILGLMYYLWKWGERILVLEPLAAIVVFPLLGMLVKKLIRRPRPDIIPHLVVEHSSSFPSGHTLTAVGVYGLAMVLLWTHGKRGWAVTSGIWMLLVALSRIYLGVHYPSDVLGSLALGTVILIILSSVFHSILMPLEEKGCAKKH